MGGLRVLDQPDRKGVIALAWLVDLLGWVALWKIVKRYQTAPRF